MVIVNCEGLPCPQPLIATRKAMRENPVGTEICVIVDNATARHNVTQMLATYDVAISFTEQGGLFRGTFTNPEVLGDVLSPSLDAQVHCETFVEPSAQVVVLCATDVLGQGDEKLGNILMKGFLSTLAEWETLPQEILFLNAGVRLCLRDSGALETLKALDAKGVGLHICGTCVDFYGVREQVAVGSITNMQYISEALAKATKVIRL